MTFSNSVLFSGILLTAKKEEYKIREMSTNKKYACVIFLLALQPCLNLITMIVNYCLLNNKEFYYSNK